MDSSETNLKHAHMEGHTSVCFEPKGRYLLTCGSDGYVRIWDGFEDCDPETKLVAENALTLAIIGSKFYVGNDSNSVFAYTFPKNQPDGLVTRFQAPVTHIVASDDGKALLVGSSDFTIKYVELSNNNFKVLMGHDAPILSVALDPLNDYAASSSCDGTVRIWKIAKQKCVKSWAAVFPSSNDFSNSKVLGRLTWQPMTGKYVAVPCEKTVKLYCREKWDDEKILKDPTINELVNVTCFSNCGTYLAAGCLNGIVVVWNMNTFKAIKRFKHDMDLTICSIAWNPTGNGDIAICDTRGQMCFFKNILLNQESNVGQDEDFLNVDELLGVVDDDDDDDNSFSISKIKAELDINKFDNDEINLVGADENDDSLSSKVKSSANVVVQPQYEVQPPFQPGSTPTFYQRRFMVWNSVGITRCFDTEDENSIEIEFHDNSLHHSIHLENTLSHKMADMSNSAVVLACKSQPNIPSQLVCLHFASWDNHKQWSCEMNENEIIEAISVSDEWVAIVTNLQVRIFSIGGIQLHVLSIAGPVVAIAGHQDQFIIAYHQGLGLPGSQNLAAVLISVTFKNVNSLNVSLPISSKSTLSWLGFTDECTPCAVDSNGIVRLFSKSSGDCWLQVANTKSQAKGLSDHHFVVGLSEIQQNIRCIPCKGSRYPPTLPHPTLILLPFELPLCGLSTQFRQMEENLRRTAMLSQLFTMLDAQGFETDATHAQRTQNQQKELTMKLFAVACRNDRDFQAAELAKMMDSYHTVQHAIRYATQLRHHHLAEKLNEIAYEKLAEETVQEQSENIETETPIENDTLASRPTNARSNSLLTSSNSSRNQEKLASQSLSTVDETYEESQELFEETPALPTPVFTNESRHNPFKLNLTQSNKKGISSLDNIKLNESKKVLLENPKVTPKTTKQQTKLSSSINGFLKNKSDEKCKTQSPINKLGVHFWMEANLESLKSDHPEAAADESQLAVLAARAFKKLPVDEKLKWNSMVQNKSDKKRKSDEENDCRPSPKLLKNESSKSPNTPVSKKNDNTKAADKLKSFAFQS